MERSAFLIVLILVCTKNWTSGHHQHEYEWTPHVNNLKVILRTLNNKLSDMDNRMSDLNFLDHAFKVNRVDNNLASTIQSVSSIDARITRIDTQAEIIKEMLRSISESTGPSCRADLIEKTAENKDHSSQRAGDESSDCKDLSATVHDYGYKIAKWQQELKVGDQRRQRAIKIVSDTTHGGFTKILQKVRILHNTEGQLYRMSTKMYSMSTDLRQAVTSLWNIFQRLVTVQKEVTNAHRMMSNSGRNSEDIAVSASLIHAMELGNTMNDDLEKLGEIEPDIVLAKKIAHNLLTGADYRRPTPMQTLKNLTMILEKIATTTTPLLFSVPYNFGGIHELLETSLDTLGNHHITVCNFQDVLKMELKAINERMDKQGTGVCLPKASGRTNDDTEEEFEKGMYATITQKQASEYVGHVQSTIRYIKMDLEEIFNDCPGGSLPAVRPLGMVRG